ncbi:MAG TPA: GIY-YIG nuclease family protein, partial [Polyangiaceae bacterium]
MPTNARRKRPASKSEVAKRSKHWFVYLVRCADGTLYCGIARDVAARLRDHEAGRGARYTRGRGPLALLASRRCREHGTALRLELLVKRLSRAEKLTLVSNPSLLGRLARRASRARKLASAFGVLIACLALASTGRAETSMKLRVLTWNVWGVPVITSHLDERLAAVPDAVLGLEPDVVFFQELWTAKHAESVARRLSGRGFRDVRRFESTEGVTGLVVASKLPLENAVFRPFEIGRTPHSLWHLDWMVSKGLASAVVETPFGPLTLENTHLQAQYRTDRYDAERLAQASEIVLSNRERSADALLIAGDFNGRGDELPRRALRDLAALEDANPSGEDSVFVRGSRTLAVRVVSVRKALDEPWKLASGSEPLSDHAALLVELELSRCADCRPIRRVTSATRTATVSSLERAADITPFRVILSLSTTGALVVLAVGLRRRFGAFLAPTRGKTALRLVLFGLIASAI